MVVVSAIGWNVVVVSGIVVVVVVVVVVVADNAGGILPRSISLKPPDLGAPHPRSCLQ